jgi:hypothetical protein
MNTQWGHFVSPHPSLLELTRSPVELTRFHLYDSNENPFKSLICGDVPSPHPSPLELTTYTIFMEERTSIYKIEKRCIPFVMQRNTQQWNTGSMS